MNLYLISQDIVGGYDTYDSAIVAAKTTEDAKTIHPSEFVTHIANSKWMGTFSGGVAVGDEYENETSSWVEYKDIENIKVELLGVTTKPRGLILAYFNAG